MAPSLCRRGQERSSGRIRTESAGPRTCIERTYREVIHEHCKRPEAKALGPDGEPCTGQTVGLLQPRHIEVLGFTHVGKEANALDLVEAGMVDGVDEVLSSYWPDLWIAVQQVLSQMPTSRIQSETGASLREIDYWKAGKPRPRGDRYSRIITSCAGIPGKCSNRSMAHSFQAKVSPRLGSTPKH